MNFTDERSSVSPARRLAGNLLVLEMNLLVFVVWLLARGTEPPFSLVRCGGCLKDHGVHDKHTHMLGTHAAVFPMPVSGCEFLCISVTW